MKISCIPIGPTPHLSSPSPIFVPFDTFWVVPFPHLMICFRFYPSIGSGAPLQPGCQDLGSQAPPSLLALQFHACKMSLFAPGTLNVLCPFLTRDYQ
jgi:hypothetical protein